MPASSFQQQKLRVCEVCSAYLGLHDNDRRLADHFGGKLHLGFIQIREKLDNLKVCSSTYTLNCFNRLDVLKSEMGGNVGKHTELGSFPIKYFFNCCIRKLWLRSKRRGTRIAWREGKKERRKKWWKKGTFVFWNTDNVYKDSVDAFYHII